ncbi:pseudouridine synthase [Oscillospiraceae bacterium WX1]
MDSIRLDKFISDAGIASRREGIRLIKAGFVVVDGVTALSGALKIDPQSAVISVSGKTLTYQKYHYLMLNKPAGVVSATEDRGEKTVNDLLEGPWAHIGLFPAGRLDKDAEGLMILTDDGAFAHRVLSPSKHVYKTYYVETKGALTSQDAEAFKNGVMLKDGLCCLPASLQIISADFTSAAYVRICEGKYHQVKRMLASQGKPVTFLKRVAVGGLRLDARLQPGAYREMTQEELACVFEPIDIWKNIV